MSVFRPEHALDNYFVFIFLFPQNLSAAPCHWEKTKYVIEPEDNSTHFAILLQTWTSSIALLAVRKSLPFQARESWGRGYPKFRTLTCSQNGTLQKWNSSQREVTKLNHHLSYWKEVATYKERSPSPKTGEMNCLFSCLRRGESRWYYI